MSTANQLTQQEKRACIILSDLFLDTEHTPSCINLLSSSLRQLEIPTSTLEHLLRNDVFPIVYLNLISIAGVWGAFDDDWLLQRVEARRSSGASWVKIGVEAVAWHSLGYLFWPTWKKVKEGLNEVSDAKV